MLYNELPIAFPWYERIEQQDRRREEVEGTNEYMLISPSNSLLPFQFTKPIEADVTILSWTVNDKCTDAVVRTLSNTNISTIRKAVRAGLEYYTFPGVVLVGTTIPTGCYYSIITFTSGIMRYSETFKVPAPPNRFTVAASATTPYTRLQWWNDSDLAPIFYNDTFNLRPSLINTVYLETYISGSDPEVVISGDPDGVQEQIRTFQKFFVPYKIIDLVTDSLKKALMVMQIHDHIVITTPYGVRSGEVSNVVVTQTQEADYARSNIDIVWHENVIVKTNCAENMT